MIITTFEALHPGLHYRLSDVPDRREQTVYRKLDRLHSVCVYRRQDDGPKFATLGERRSRRVVVCDPDGVPIEP